MKAKTAYFNYFQQKDKGQIFLTMAAQVQNGVEESSFTSRLNSFTSINPNRNAISL